MHLEEYLQVFRGFKDKITENTKKREKLIKDVADNILSSSFLPYADQYSENISNFLSQLDQKEIKSFYSQFDKSYGSIIGEYENLIASMHKNKLDWKKALLKNKKVGDSILSALFGKKKKDSEKIKIEEEDILEESEKETVTKVDSIENIL